MTNTIIISIAQNVLAILIPALIALVFEYLRRRLGNEKLQKLQQELATKQELAGLAVLFAQQVYAQLDGHSRYVAASRWLSEQAQARGIRLTEDEIMGLIEAAVKTAKLEFGEQWKVLQRQDNAVSDLK